MRTEGKTTRAQPTRMGHRPKWPHIGVEGLDAREAQADAAESLEGLGAPALEEDVGPVGVERSENARIERDDVVDAHSYGRRG
jgi:hypothetical protein